MVSGSVELTLSALVAEEAREAGALGSGLWSTTSAQEEARLEEEGGVAVEIVLAAAHDAVTFVLLGACKQAVPRVAHEFTFRAQEFERNCLGIGIAYTHSRQASGWNRNLIEVENEGNGQAPVWMQKEARILNSEVPSAFMILIAFCSFIAAKK